MAVIVPALIAVHLCRRENVPQIVVSGRASDRPRTSRRCRAGAATAAGTDRRRRRRAARAAPVGRAPASTSSRAGQHLGRRRRRSPGGAVSRSRTPTTPPGARASSAESSSASWSGCSSSTSAAVRRQRDSGRRRRAPRPVHGTSASTRSKPRGCQAGRVPSATTTVGGCGVAAQSLRDQSRPVRGDARRPPAGRTARHASPASSAALPPGPAHRSSHQPRRRRRRDPRQRRRPPAATPRPGPRPCPRGRPASSAGLPDQRAAYGLQRRRLGAGGEQLVDRRPVPGRTTRLTGAEHVVGQQRGLDLLGRQQVGVRVDDPASGARCAAPTPRASSRPAASVGPPTRTRCGPRPCAAPRSPARSPAYRPSPAARSTVAATAACDGTRMLSSWWAAEPEQVEHGRLQRARAPRPDGGHDDRS